MRGFAAGDDICPLGKRFCKIGPQVSVWRPAAASARFPRLRDVGYVRYFWHGHSTYKHAPFQKEILEIGRLVHFWWPAAAPPRFWRPASPREMIYVH